MKYTLLFSDRARKHILQWQRSGQKKILQKIYGLIEELKEHPYTGTGKPEQLKEGLTGYWSRRIDKKNRLVYAIEDEVVSVEVVSAKGHYADS